MIDIAPDEAPAREPGLQKHKSPRPHETLVRFDNHPTAPVPPRTENVPDEALAREPGLLTLDLPASEDMQQGDDTPQERGLKDLECFLRKPWCCK